MTLSTTWSDQHSCSTIVSYKGEGPVVHSPSTWTSTFVLPEPIVKAWSDRRQQSVGHRSLGGPRLELRFSSPTISTLYVPTGTSQYPPTRPWCHVETSYRNTPSVPTVRVPLHGLTVDRPLARGSVEEGPSGQDPRPTPLRYTSGDGTES